MEPLFVILVVFLLIEASYFVLALYSYLISALDLFLERQLFATAQKVSFIYFSKPVGFDVLLCVLMTNPFKLNSTLEGLASWLIPCGFQSRVSV